MPAPGLMAERALGLDEEGWPSNRRSYGDRSFQAIFPPIAVVCLAPGFGSFGLVHALEGARCGVLDGLRIAEGRHIEAASRGAEAAGIVQGHHQQAAALNRCVRGGVAGADLTHVHEGGAVEASFGFESAG